MIQMLYFIVVSTLLFSISISAAGSEIKIKMAHTKYSIYKKGAHQIQAKKGHYIVRYKDGTNENKRNALRNKFKNVDRNIGINIDRFVDVGLKQSAEETIKKLTQNEDVAFAEPDIILKSLDRDDNLEMDRVLSRQWMLRKIQKSLYSSKLKGKSIRVGLLDTGIDSLQEDLPLSKGVSFIKDTLENGSIDSSTMDHNGHGTKVAGIIGAYPDNDRGITGIANNCALVPIKVFSIDGDAVLSDVIAGIEWATINNIAVLNMSFGTYENSQILEEIINRAANNGIILVGAAGNDANESKMYPGAYNNVICVGSTSENGLISDFSNFGSHIDILAPGKAILSTGITRNNTSSYEAFSGTSASCAFVSGVIVHLLQQNVQGTRNIKRIINNNSDYTFSERIASCYMGLFEINPDRIFDAISNKKTDQGATLIGLVCRKTWLSFNDSLQIMIAVQNRSQVHSKRTEVILKIDDLLQTHSITIPILPPNQIYAQRVIVPTNTLGLPTGQHTVSGYLRDRDTLPPLNDRFLLTEAVENKYDIIAPCIDHSLLVDQSTMKVNFTLKQVSTKVPKGLITMVLETAVATLDTIITDTLWKKVSLQDGLNETRMSATFPINEQEIANKRVLILRLSNEYGNQVGAARIDIKPKSNGFFIQYDHSFSHKKLTEAAINLLSLQFGNKPWVQYFKNKMEIIKQGAFNEDGSYDLVGGRVPYNLYYLTYSHFWQADNSDSKRVKSDVFNALEEINSYINGPLYLDWTVRLTGSWYFDVWSSQSGSDGLMKYSSKYPNNDYTFDLLGRVMHLIQDMTVPAHIHEDLHGAAAGQLILGDESYENWLSGQHRFNEYSALDAGGIINPYLISKSNPIRGLAWSNAQVADYFASDGVNGNPSLGNRKDEFFQLNISRNNNADPRDALPERPTSWYWDFSCRECQNWCFWIACPGKTYYDRIYAAPEQCTGADNKDCMSSPGRGFVANNTVKDGICDQSNDCGDDDADGDLSRVAAKCYVRAIQSSAGFLYWFAKEKGMINPLPAGVTTFILND